MPVVTYNLSEAEEAKLARLARARGKSPEACIKEFIAACQPGGSGWLNPEAASKPSPVSKEKKT